MSCAMCVLPRGSISSDPLLAQADDAAGLTPGEEVTLMQWGNVIIKEVLKDPSGTVTGMSADLHLEGSVKTTKKKLTWLACTPELVDVKLVDLDFLLNKDKARRLGFDNSIEGTPFGAPVFLPSLRAHFLLTTG